MAIIKISKAPSLVKDPTHPLNPMDASHFYGFVFVDGKRVGTVDHLYRRREYRFMPDWERGADRKKAFCVSSLAKLKLRVAAEFA